MTNLEWIRTLSAKELSDLLYDYWLPRGQYVWTDSRKGLMKVLGEKYLERDCDKCKHQGNCYCVKGLGCPFEPKDENSAEIPTSSTISKMEQVDKDINVRSKTEPQRGCDADCNEDCTECAKEWQDWKDQMWTEAVIASKDEPQTDCSWR